jgi:hypothetical protein
MQFKLKRKFLNVSLDLQMASAAEGHLAERAK